jgi:putative ABC transport system permease protein
MAIPPSWYVMHRWLENYVYKTDITIYDISLSGIIILIVSLLTVSFQSWRAATRNPVEALRYE